MEAWFEKNVLEPDFPFRLFINEGYTSVPHHWHDEIEIIYMVEGGVRVGVNNNIYNLLEGDIFIIGSGDIHYFLPEYNKSSRVVIQFNLSIFDNIASGIEERQRLRPLFHRSKRLSSFWGKEVKDDVEKQIKELIREYNEKKEGYKLALKARLYDLVVLLLRKVPIETLTFEEDSKQRDVLRRLENVFEFVENNYISDITLEDAAKEAGFSVYHFSRFFKQNAGMTFGQYLNNFRITKAEWFLINDDDNITEIAFKSGFNSVKTFNRVFKEIKKCSPTEYRKKQNMRINEQ
jgi:AraC-like DNA-binding protein/quercetin dioxygenase-like cupin family protein